MPSYFVTHSKAGCILQGSVAAMLFEIQSAFALWQKHFWSLHCKFSAYCRWKNFENRSIFDAIM